MRSEDAKGLSGWSTASKKMSFETREKLHRIGFRQVADSFRMDPVVCMSWPRVMIDHYIQSIESSLEIMRPLLNSNLLAFESVESNHGAYTPTRSPAQSFKRSSPLKAIERRRRSTQPASSTTGSSNNNSRKARR